MTPADLGGSFVDVLPRVSVLGHWLTGGPGEDRRRELVHLAAGVVDVVLGAHLGARGPQQPCESVAERRPPGVPDVQRTGRVAGDELEVDRVPGLGGVPAVLRAGL